MAQVMIRLLGGPQDDALTSVLTEQEDSAGILEVAVLDQESFIRATRGDKIAMRIGVYEAMGFADDDGHPIFRWVGFREDIANDEAQP